MGHHGKGHQQHGKKHHTKNIHSTRSPTSNLINLKDENTNDVDNINKNDTTTNLSTEITSTDTTYDLAEDYENVQYGIANADEDILNEIPVVPESFEGIDYQDTNINININNEKTNANYMDTRNAGDLILQQYGNDVDNLDTISNVAHASSLPSASYTEHENDSDFDNERLARDPFDSTYNDTETPEIVNEYITNTSMNIPYKNDEDGNNTSSEMNTSNNNKNKNIIREGSTNEIDTDYLFVLPPHKLVDLNQLQKSISGTNLPKNVEAIHEINNIDFYSGDMIGWTATDVNNPIPLPPTGIKSDRDNIDKGDVEEEDIDKNSNYPRKNSEISLGNKVTSTNMNTDPYHPILNAINASSSSSSIPKENMDTSYRPLHSKAVEKVIPSFVESTASTTKNKVAKTIPSTSSRSISKLDTLTKYLGNNFFFIISVLTLPLLYPILAYIYKSYHKMGASTVHHNGNIMNAIHKGYPMVHDVTVDMLPDWKALQDYSSSSSFIGDVMTSITSDLGALTKLDLHRMLANNDIGSLVYNDMIYVDSVNKNEIAHDYSTLSPDDIDMSINELPDEALHTMILDLVS